jgi:hypothetical protein
MGAAKKPAEDPPGRGNAEGPNEHPPGADAAAD